jgi:hypothetical protein
MMTSSQIADIAQAGEVYIQGDFLSVFDTAVCQPEGPNSANQTITAPLNTPTRFQLIYPWRAAAPKGLPSVVGGEFHVDERHDPALEGVGNQEIVVAPIVLNPPNLDAQVPQYVEVIVVLSSMTHLDVYLHGVVSYADPLNLKAPCQWNNDPTYHLTMNRTP